VLRAVKKTFTKDPTAERQVVAAMRMSIADMLNSNAAHADIIRELELTEKMLRFNIAQVRYKENIDSYTVKLTDEMVSKDGCVVDIRTPGDLQEEQSKDLDDLIGRVNK
jgi:hypothetical protein